MREKLIAASRATYRVARRFAVTFGVIVAVILVSTLTIDLGPALRHGRAGGRQLARTKADHRPPGRAARPRPVRGRELQIDGMFPKRAAVAGRQNASRCREVGRTSGREVLFDSIEMPTADGGRILPGGRQTSQARRAAASAPHPAAIVCHPMHTCAPTAASWSSTISIRLRAVAPNREVTVAKGDKLSRQHAIFRRHHRDQKYEPMRPTDGVAGVRRREDS